MMMTEIRRLIENGTRFIEYPMKSDSEIGTSTTMWDRADLSIVPRRLILHMFCYNLLDLTEENSSRLRVRVCEGASSMVPDKGDIPRDLGVIIRREPYPLEESAAGHIPQKHSFRRVFALDLHDSMFLDQLRHPFSQDPFFRVGCDVNGGEIVGPVEFLGLFDIDCVQDTIFCFFYLFGFFDGGYVFLLMLKSLFMGLHRRLPGLLFVGGQLFDR